MRPDETRRGGAPAPARGIGALGSAVVRPGGEGDEGVGAGAIRTAAASAAGGGVAGRGVVGAPAGMRASGALEPLAGGTKAAWGEAGGGRTARIEALEPGRRGWADGMSPTTWSDATSIERGVGKPI